MRGHPWVYKEAIAAPSAIAKAQLCQVVDAKGELAWAMYDPHSVLSVRVISTDKGPPTDDFYAKRLARAHSLRDPIRSESTTAYRLLNGEGDLLPGLVCDVYGDIAVVQFDGQGPSEFWDRSFVANWIASNTDCKTVVEKHRRSSDRPLEVLVGKLDSSEVIVSENNARFIVDIEKGQKTGFFLDQRDNRKYVRDMSAGKSVLNLFSYSGGFSINAGLGGASRVASLDISKGAIDLAERSWIENGLDKTKHEPLCVDVFEYLNAAQENWDHIIVDPPSMGPSESKKEAAAAKYVAAFAAAAKRVKPRGDFSVSSCSSHISFDDFLQIIEEALSVARRRGQILRVSGQGADHPFPHACHELRYLKFVHLALD